MTKAVESLKDEELMERIRDGDSAAFAAIVRRHTTRFYAVAFRVLLNREDAEDVVQDAFCKLWNGKATWQGDKGARFTTWFYRIVTNQAVDQLAKKSRQRGTVLDDNLASGGPDAEDRAVARQEEHAVVAALAELPERQRTAITLFYNEEMSQKEAAEVMGITQKAVESLIGRAKQSLKERMQVYA